MSRWFKKKKKQQEKDQVVEVVNNEDQINMDFQHLQTKSQEELWELVQKYDADLKAAQQMIEDGKTVQRDRDKLAEEIKSYKDHSENLQSYIQKLVKEMNDYKSQLDSKLQEITLINTQLESKDELITQYTSQIEQLRKNQAEAEPTVQQVTETVKTTQWMTPENEQDFKELQIVHKTMEAENERLVLQINSLKTEGKNLKESLAAVEKEKKEIEMESYKRQIENDVAKRDLTNLQFQKDSAENEVIFLKNSLMEKDARYHKKHVKHEKTMKQNKELITQASNLKYETELQISRHQLEAQKLKDDFDRELRFRDEIGQAKMANLEREAIEKGKSLEIAYENASNLREKLEDRDKTLNGRENEFLDQKQQLQLFNIKIASLESENLKLQSQLEESQKKREMARKEVIRLNKQFETRTTPKSSQQPQANYNPQKISDVTVQENEYKVLSILKREFEVIYKHLMKLMMTAKTTKMQGEKVCYLLDTDEFSEFERRLNNIVMQVHEASEAPLNFLNEVPAVTPPPSTTTKGKGKVLNVMKSFRGKGPLKLFSCLAQKESEQPTVPLKANTGERPQRSQAAPIQRRGSVDRSNYRQF